MTTRQFEFLAQTCQAFAEPVDFGAGLPVLVRLAVPLMAEWAAVDLAEPDGTIRRAAAAHANPAKEQLVFDLRLRHPANWRTPGGVPEVLRSGRAVLIPDFGQAQPTDQDQVLEWTGDDDEYLRTLRDVGLRSALIAPIANRGRVLGALTLVSDEPARRYGREDLLLVQNLIGRFLGATERAPLRRDVDEAGPLVDRLEREVRLAREQVRRLFDGVSDALLLTDEHGRYLDANASATALLGYSRQEIVQMRVGDLPAIGPSWTEAERGRFAREGTWRGNMLIRRKNGMMLPVEVRVTAVVTATETMYLASLRDMSARQALDRIQHDLAAVLEREVRHLRPIVRRVVRRVRDRYALPRGSGSGRSNQS